MKQNRTRDINFLGGNHQQIFFLAEWAGHEEKHGRKGNYSSIFIDPFYMYVHIIKYFQTVQAFVADFIALDTPPCDSNIQTASRSFCLSVNWNRSCPHVQPAQYTHLPNASFYFPQPSGQAVVSNTVCWLMYNLFSNYTSYFNQMKLFVQDQRCKKRN